MRVLPTFLIALFTALPAVAACTGQNQIDLLPAETRAALIARANAAPFAQGNLWQATKDGRTATLFGTYHLDDPRNEALMTALAPRIEDATAILVEAGPLEEAALRADLARDPTLMFTADGPTLPESLPPETWEALKKALRDRSVPPFMAARMQPGYLAMILGMPPCAMPDIRAGKPGLDKRIIARAEAAGIPVRALEPHDTLFTIFGALTPLDQRALLDAALALAGQSDDAVHTLADSYHSQQSCLIWELSILQAHADPSLPPDSIDRSFAQVEESLVKARNRAWIPVIEAAAARGPVLAAFGALHLSGHDGVLDLLARRGWTVQRLPL